MACAFAGASAGLVLGFWQAFQRASHELGARLHHCFVNPRGSQPGAYLAHCRGCITPLQVLRLPSPPASRSSKPRSPAPRPLLNLAVLSQDRQVWLLGEVVCTHN